MKDVIQKAQELALSIKSSDIYRRMAEAEKASETDREAAAAVAAYMEARNRVQELVGSTDDQGRIALTEAAQTMQTAEDAMNAQPTIHEMQEARKAFDEMMESVNRVLRLIINGDPTELPASGCTGSCATCGGCAAKR